MSNFAQIRPWKPEDYDFVMSSWLRSYQKSPWAGSIPNNLYWDTYQAALEQLIGSKVHDTRPREGVFIDVATNPFEDDPKYEIFGWICTETGFPRPVVHYIYVKEAFRRQGLAKQLLKEAVHSEMLSDMEFVYTFRTPASQVLFKDLNGKFDPTPVRTKK